MTTASSAAARLDRMPVTAFHRRIAWAIGAGLLVDGFDVYLASGVAGAMVKQGLASLPQVGLLVSLSLVGLGLGGMASGWFADRNGRRVALRWTLGLVFVGSIGSAFAADMNQLIAWRFLTSLGLGGETVLGYALLAEFVPPQVRGRWMAWLALLANLGMPLALLAGFFLLPHDIGWRVMLAIPAAAAVPVFLMRRGLSESPRWLSTKGRHDEAELILKAVEATSPVPLAEVVASETAPATVVGHPARTAFNIRGLIVGSSINIAITTAIFSFVSWLPTFFASEGHDIAASVMFAGVMSLGCPLGVVLGMAVTDRVERKWGIVWGGVVVAALGCAYALASGQSMILAAGFCVVTAVYFTGTLGLTGYIPELFSTETRMRSVAICSTTGRAVAVVMPFLIVPVFAHFGQAGVVGVVSVVLVLQAVVVALFGARTKARSLETVA